MLRMRSISRFRLSGVSFKPRTTFWILLLANTMLTLINAFKRENLHVQGTLDSIDLNTIGIETNYTGPRLENGQVTTRFMNNLIEFYNQSLETKSWRILHHKYVFEILRQVRDHFKKQPSLIEIKLPEKKHIIIGGDIHGKLEDLLHIFDIRGLPSSKNRYLFNGNFVDRRPYSIECALIFFGFKLLYPDMFFINRGCHEDIKENLEQYGLAEEVEEKYPGNEKLLHGFWEVFQWLPLAYLISNDNVAEKVGDERTWRDSKIIGKFVAKGQDMYDRVLQKITNPLNRTGAYAPKHQRVLVVHGGLFSRRNVMLSDIKEIKRGCDAIDHGHSSLMFDLLWSDPGFKEGRHQNTLRYTSIQFGPNVSESFCNRNDIDYIIRSHAPLKHGYHVEHNGRIVTVFSTTNYHNLNYGAVLVLQAPILKPKFTTYGWGRFSTSWTDEKDIPVGRYTTVGADPTGSGGMFG